MEGKENPARVTKKRGKAINDNGVRRPEREGIQQRGKTRSLSQREGGRRGGSQNVSLYYKLGEKERVIPT